MITDPIVDELDRLRVEQIARFNFDFESFFQDLKEQEKFFPQAVQPVFCATMETPGGRERKLSEWQEALCIARYTVVEWTITIA